MLVIGNGESRSGVDINSFTCTKVGCNALYRDYRVRHLVCVDRKMLREVIDNQYNMDSLIYTRKDWVGEFANNKNIRVLPELPYIGSDRWDEPINWNSGPYAILVAVRIAKKQQYFDNQINLIGFDLYGTTDNKINNIYKDTDNYELSRKRAVDPRYWIIQIAKIAECYPELKFTFYNPENWQHPASWKSHANITVDKLSNLQYN